MIFSLTALAVVAAFLPFIILAAHTPKDERRMRARFALLQIGGAGGLSSSKQTELFKAAQQGPSGWQAALVLHISAWLRLDVLLLRAKSRQTPWNLLRRCGLCALATLLVTLIGTRSFLTSTILGAVAGSVPLLLLRMQANRRTDAMNKVLPQVMEMISRALRAGHSLPAALGIVAEEAAEPARTAFAEVYQKQNFGLPLRDALMELIHCFPSEDLKVLVTAILVQRDTGGNLVQILDRTSAVIRERLKLQGDVRVHTAQGRMTGWVLCLLPVLMLCMLLVTNPSYPKSLVDDPLGRKLIYVGIALLGIGAFLIQRIVKGIEV